MPREGLTSVLRSCPSEVRIAVLNESIRAVTCGSPQIVAGFGGAVTDPPGRGVEAPGVCATVEGVPINKVEVGRAINVGVAGGSVAGDAQPANRIKLSRKDRSILVFIFISSFTSHLKNSFPSHLHRHASAGVARRVHF